MSEHFTGFTFDAAGITYTYDGDGDRVQKSNGKIYWYGAGTEILDETDLTGSTTNSSFNEYVYYDGERVARRDYQSNVFYYFTDQVGSSRGIAEVPHGATTAALCYDADFFPFGGEHDYTNTCPQNYKFTGKERDPETNNDDFDARYYSSTYGRFLSADWSAVPAPVPYANLTNPQTLNLYAIVNDNPESFADLDGHLPPVGSENCGSNGSCGSDPNESANVSSINTGTAQVNQTQSTATAQQQNSNSTTTTVTLNSRPADIPGGQLLHDAGVNHEWISTPDGTDVGMGTAKGVPQSDAPGEKTQVVDHTGQVPTSTQTFTGVNKAALATYTQVGTPTGRWVPGVNDCNTWAHNAINQSTPHDIYSGLPGISAVLYHNAVVYADGSIH